MSSRITVRIAVRMMCAVAAVLFVTLSSGQAIAQPVTDGGGRVGVGTLSPAPTAMFDVWSTDHGMLIPRLTTAQRNAIGAPAEGLLIYNTDVGSIQVWSDASGVWQWDQFVTTGTNDSWLTAGNGGLIAGINNILGTLDGVGIDLRTNNLTALTVSAADQSIDLTSDLTVGGSLTVDNGESLTGRLRFEGGSSPLWASGSDGNFGDVLISGGAATTPSWQSPNGLFWELDGNSGTTPGTHFVGTTDNNRLHFRANNVDRLILGTNGSIQRDAGGNPRGFNSVDLQNSRSAANQVASGQSAVVGGGIRNTSSGFGSVVGGGAENVAGQNYSTVTGGIQNTASGIQAFIGGGFGNTASSLSAAIAGGFDNTASNQDAFIGAGASNVASGSNSAVSSGVQNVASGQSSFVGAGDNNGASGRWSMVGGGNGNVASADLTTVGGGDRNAATGNFGTVAGGSENRATGIAYATVGGGWQNVAAGREATVAGGTQNMVPGQLSTVGGGGFNSVSGLQSVVSGGVFNTVQGDLSAIAGGRGLTLTGSADRSFGFLGGNPVIGNDMTISAADVAVFGNVDLWLANNNSSASQLRFYEPYGTSGAFPNTAHYTSFRAVPQAANVNYTLPPDDGTPGQVLTTDGTGVLNWQAAGMGGLAYSRATTSGPVYNVPNGVCLIGVDVSGGAVTVNLQDASNYGVGEVMIVNVEQGNAGVNNVTINAAAGDTFDGTGATSLTITFAQGQFKMYSDGANGWFTY